MANANVGGSNVLNAIIKEYSKFISTDHCFKLAVTILLCGVTLIWWAYGGSSSSSGGDLADDKNSILKEADVQSLQTEDPSDDSDIDDNDDDDENKSQQTTSSSASSTIAAHPTNNLHKPITKCPTREKARAQGLVLYNKHWYNVSKFIAHHPGGSELLEQYLGTDITHVFHVMHRNPKQIMKYRKPVRGATEEEMEELLQRRNEVSQEMFDEYEEGVMTKSHAADFFNRERFNLEAFEKDAGELYEDFTKAGYTKPTFGFVAQKTALVLMFLFLSVLCMKCASSDDHQSIIATTPLSYILPGIFLGLFWHQSGFLMHDAEHHNLIGNELVNDILGWLYGTVFLGVNGAWWREEHREHHAFLNAFDEAGFKDPQMKEDIWIQNANLIPFYGQELIHFLANFQHILFIPIIFFAGRIGIVVDSTLTERKFRPWTILGNVFHVLLHYAVLSQTSTPIRVYMAGACQFAVLSLQLLGNHHIKPWNNIHSASEGNFSVWQILCTQDFDTPIWFRWFYGGLNFHYSHHLFPTISREYFPITTPRIRSLCEKHGLPFIEVGFVECVTGMVTNMNEVKKEFAKHGAGTLSLVYG